MLCFSFSHVQTFCLCDGQSVGQALSRLTTQAPSRFRHRGTAAPKPRSILVARPNSAQRLTVPITQEPASNTWFRPLQNNTTCIHIWVVFLLLLRELPVKHPQLILKKENKVYLLTQLKQMLLHFTTDIVFRMTRGVKVRVYVYIFVCLWAFSVFWLWAGMDWVCFCLDW